MGVPMLGGIPHPNKDSNYSVKLPIASAVNV
jgi:hypothetical protein